MHKSSWFLAGCLAGVILAVPGSVSAQATLRALLIDGQNNHNWQATTPVLKKIVEDTGLFRVDVVTSPGSGQPMVNFKPDFAKYQVVILNYNGDEWAQPTRDAFVAYMREGGGLVVQHGSDNTFPKWPEFNEMIGVGGWGGRDEKSGPMIYWREGKVVADNTPGPGGTHGAQAPFQVVIRDSKHPITAGLPGVWMHSDDELYSKLRGPAQNLTLLATGKGDPAKGATGRDEPCLMALRYGKGRIFHTTLGHDAPQLHCVGFIVTFQRGVEWAATGKVSDTSIPADFPGPDKVSLRP
jgi:uncharacterized protein